MNFIFGYGYFGRAVSQAMKARGLSFQFVDTYYDGPELADGTVVRPSDVQVGPQDSLWLTAYAQPTSASRETVTRKAVEAMSPATIYELNEISRRLPEVWRILVADGFMWRSATAQTVAPLWDAARAAAIRPYFYDDESRALFDRIERFRAEPMFDTYPWPTTGPQYFAVGNSDGDLFRHSDVQMLDIGAFDGDTLRDAHRVLGKKLRRYVGFEPMQNSFAAVKKSIAAIEGDLPDFSGVAFKNATGSAPAVVHFSNQGSASTQGEGAAGMSERVEIVRLDDVEACAGTTFLKMDIEGGEMETLLGAEALLTEHRPSCAIAVYHRADDLWKMPEFFLERFPDARFSLRQHHHWGLELVLYVSLQ